MMTTIRGASLRRPLVIAALAVTAVACADKAFTPPAKALFSSRMSLQLSTTASQVATTPRYVWVGAGGVIAGGDTALLAMTFALVTGGTQNITLNVDLAPCFAANAAKGHSGCSIIIGAALRADTMSGADTTQRDPFRRVFDYALLGPYDVSSGRAPTIPPIDLSASRFAVLDWTGDEALRLGGAQHIAVAGGSQGRSLAGASSGTGSPALYAVTFGSTGTSSAANVPPPYYPALAIFENGAWRRVLGTAAGAINISTTQFQGFTDVTALATNDVYVSATNGLYKFDGSTITRITSISDSLYAVASGISAGTRYVIAGGPAGVTWIGNTTTWQRSVAPTTARLDGVCITGPSEAFASSSTSGELFRFNGSTWASVSIASFPGGKTDLQCPAPGQVYVLSVGGNMWRWNGSGWTQLPSTGIGAGRAVRWGVVSPSEIYAVGDSSGVDRAYYRFDGSQWGQIARRAYTQAPVRVWADPRGGVAYALSGFGRLEKISTTTSVLSYQPGLRDAVITSATSAFAVGWNMFLARWNGAQWIVDTPPAGTPATRILQGVWSDGPKNAWAVGNLSTIVRYDGSSWTVVSDQTRPIALADGYNAVWGIGSDVWAVGEASIVHCKAPTACAVESSTGGTLYGVWGSSSSNIFAVGAGGRILKYNGSSWSAMNSPTNRALARVAGSGPSDVWAVGDSVLIHYDGTSWTSTPLTGDLQWMQTHVPSQLQSLFQVGLWVRSPKEVYLGADNGQIFRFDGSGWREAAYGGMGFRRVLAITGASGCAFAVTEGQTDAPQPTILRGIGTNGCMASPMAPPSIWP